MENGENRTGTGNRFSAALGKCIEIEERFSVLGEQLKKDGALSQKEKELICLAIAVVKGCIWCVRRHTAAAIDLGASYEQVIEAASMAVQMDGGPGAVRMRQLALKAIEEYDEGYRAERLGAEWDLVKVHPANVRS
jgi:AhpD family alkylhydroperoxidase